MHLTPVDYLIICFFQIFQVYPSRNGIPIKVFMLLFWFLDFPCHCFHLIRCCYSRWDLKCSFGGIQMKRKPLAARKLLQIWHLFPWLFCVFDCTAGNKYVTVLSDMGLAIYTINLSSFYVWITVIFFYVKASGLDITSVALAVVSSPCINMCEFLPFSLSSITGYISLPPVSPL